MNMDSFWIFDFGFWIWRRGTRPHPRPVLTIQNPQSKTQNRPSLVLGVFDHAEAAAAALPGDVAHVRFDQQDPPAAGAAEVFVGGRVGDGAAVEPRPLVLNDYLVPPRRHLRL